MDTDVELLMTIIGGRYAKAAAEELVKNYGIAGIRRASVHDLACVYGIGETKANRIKAAVSLGRTPGVIEGIRVTRPGDIGNYLVMTMGDLDYESMRVVVMNTRCVVLHIAEVYKGTVNSNTVRIAELFREAVRRNAANVIIAHNHPSGDPTPSPEDIVVTKAIRLGAQALEIELLDHLVVGLNRWKSMKEEGMM